MYGSRNKQRLFPYTTLTDWFYNRDGVCLLRGADYWLNLILNPLTTNDHYSGRTAPLTSKRYILYIYSTNIGTEYFKHGIYSQFFPLQNAVCFIILTFGSCIIHILYTGCAKIKKIIPAPKG